MEIEPSTTVRTMNAEPMSTPCYKSEVRTAKSVPRSLLGGAASHARNLRCPGAGRRPIFRPSSVVPGRVGPVGGGRPSCIGRYDCRLARELAQDSRRFALYWLFSRYLFFDEKTISSRLLKRRDDLSLAG